MKELARMLGKTESAVSRWESGDNSPKMEDLNKLSKILEVDMDNLVYGAPENTTLTKISQVSSQLIDERQQVVLETANIQLAEQKKKEAEERQRKILSLDKPYHDLKNLPGYVPYESESEGMAPILGEIAAGYNIMAEENFDGMMPVSAAYANRDDIFWLNIKGHSMEPIIQDSSFGLFEHCDDIEDGKIGAAMYQDGSMVTVKYIFHEYDEEGYLTRISLIPENDAYHTKYLDESNPGSIIGRLLEVKQFF